MNKFAGVSSEHRATSLEQSKDCSPLTAHRSSLHTNSLRVWRRSGREL